MYMLISKKGVIFFQAYYRIGIRFVPGVGPCEELLTERGSELA
jgi:hypothetical protein